MASVTLTECWVHDAANPSDYVTSYGFGQGGPQDVIRGDVRTYAGGRRRAITRAGRALTYERVFPGVSNEWLEWMSDHLGVTVMVRDPRGRLFFGVFFVLDVDDKFGGSPPDVSVTFESVTFPIEA